MRLKNVYVRFFRSFNFDYLRQDADGVEQLPWDTTTEGKFYPFIRVELEDDVTTIVGANESGKSQLIAAIECLLGVREISPRDFCRYSEFFTVRGSMPLPEFGGQFTDFSAEERASISQAIDTPFTGQDLWYFRFGLEEVVYTRTPEGLSRLGIQDGPVALRLPNPRRMDATAALPASVSLYDLSQGLDSPDLRGRTDWYNALKNLKVNSATFEVANNGIAPLNPPATRSTDDEKTSTESLKLARELFEKVAQIDPQAYTQLLDSETNDDAYTAALTSNMTALLRDSLNFKKWWSQDADFALELHKDGFHLVLTLRDKTGQTYTFDERSGGMKHFLSYFVQYLAYEAKDPGRSEIILADEPDAFLSAQGQQDLLAVFESYAHPLDADRSRAQVLYVTHSPFLIDRNRPERIRVLQKGLGEEGTRVVSKAAVDRYEPLRTAFNSFHADTVFIGNSNLLVEGPADQIIFSAMSAAMSSSSGRWNTLNLNRLTMVPVHGASQYRYMLHLTRSSGLDRPAVVVLLDSDHAGLEARKDLEKGFGEKPIIDPKFIIQIRDLPSAELKLSAKALEEPEDLIPLNLGLMAMEKIVDDICDPSEAPEVKKKLPPPSASVPKNERLFDFLKSKLAGAGGERKRPLELTKMDFARAISTVVSDPNTTEDFLADAFTNFDALFRVINETTEASMSENVEENLRNLTKRWVERFKRDHRTSATRRSVTFLLETIKGALTGATDEDERIRTVARRLSEDYDLGSEPLEAVDNFEQLRSRVKELVWGYSATA